MTKPSEKYQPEVYWNEVARQVSDRKDIRIMAGDDEPYYRYKRKRYLQLMDAVNFEGKSVLEIGPGPGGNLDYLTHRNCSRLAGADISSNMIELAGELLKNKNVELVKINGTELPFNNDTFDIVFTSTVLQHNTNEQNLMALMAEICRVSGDEVLLFERIENKIKGHESNLGRPISYYAGIMKKGGFDLIEKKPMPLQASYYTCGTIRKVFNPRSRKEGEPLTAFSIGLQKITLPITRWLDEIIPSNRDVIMLRFKKINSSQNNG
ncbi:MAG: class I SAM-dependent methyltransferase [Candidatus Competibacteraceae bacterium]|nr:class I SAM-dependent methyltransferase [Candidatus Competibacteraceae bacterium]